MTEQTLELAVLLPRDAECGRCVDEVGRELGRLDGVRAVEADVPRGLLTVRYDEKTLGAEGVRTFARRAGAQAHCAEHCPAAVHEHGPLDLRVPLPGEDGIEHRILHVTGMDCADCAAKLQSALRRERGVRTADVNFGAATLAVTIDPAQIDLARVFTAVRRLGYDTVEGVAERAARRAASVAGTHGTRVAPGRPEEAGSATGGSAAGGSAAGTAAAALPGMPSQRRGFWPRDRRAALVLVSGALVAGGFAAEWLAPAFAPWLFAAAMVAGGAYMARAAFFSVRARQVDMNVLMTLAAVGAAAIGQWSEAGLVVFLFGLGTWLQVATLERTRRAITGLMALTPAVATVLRGGAETSVPVADVRPGDLVLARPGERVAVDGVVAEGRAAADQAQVTGESRPVAKAPGDQVFAGSIIQGGTLRLRATTVGADTTVSRIVHLVEEAQAQRAPVQSIVDRFAARYTPVVVALAAAVAFVPLLFGGSFETWFYRGLALLIISCPCALVISTPVSILAALARSTRNGVLIKGGVFLEQAAGLRAVAFDKTGTLTAGRPRVTDVVALGAATPELVLRVAAGLERLSEHPLARAIVEHADAAGLGAAHVAGPDAAAAAGEPAAGHDPCACGHDHEPEEALVCASADCDRGEPADWLCGEPSAWLCGKPSACACGEPPSRPSRPAATGDVEHFRSIAGKGVRGEIDGRLYVVGRPDLLGERARDSAGGRNSAAGAGPAGGDGARPADDPALAVTVARLEGEGKTAVVVGDEHGPLGVIAISDPLRAGSAAAVARLRKLGVEHITMLTGDNPETAAAVAVQAGIDDVRAGLLPAEKVAAVAELRARYGAVAMVGDGINDAPALATATLGIAMGVAGTDAALETADIALMGDDLDAVPQTILLGRRTGRIIWQNIVFSIVVKAVFLVLAPLGLVSLWLAVFADMGTSLLVTANGLRLLRR